MKSKFTAPFQNGVSYLCVALMAIVLFLLSTPTRAQKQDTAKVAVADTTIIQPTNGIHYAIDGKIVTKAAFDVVKRNLAVLHGLIDAPAEFFGEHYTGRIIWKITKENLESEEVKRILAVVAKRTKSTAVFTRRGY